MLSNFAIYQQLAVVALADIKATGLWTDNDWEHPSMPGVGVTNGYLDFDSDADSSDEDVYLAP